MALYSVYVRSNGDPLALEQVRLIKSGFSWLAFAFPVVWLLLNRVWRGFLVILAVEIGLAILVERYGLPDWSLLLAGAVIMAYVGVAGRDWLGSALERRGFKAKGLFSGEDEDEAYAAFIRHPKPQNSTIAEAIPAKSTELGMNSDLFPDREARI